MEIKSLGDDASKLSECLALIEISFSYENDHHYHEDFKLLIQESNFHNCFYLQDDHQIVCTVFGLPRTLIYQDHTLPVFFIGGISVNGNYQGQGYFRQLLEHVLEQNPDQALFLLWSDLSSMYEKFNFYEFGLIEEIPGSQHTNQKLEALSLDHFNTLRKQYNDLAQHFIIPQRNPNDWRILWETQSIEKLTDQTNAYFVHKGMDLKNIIHESYPMGTTNPTPYTLWNFNSDNQSKHLARYTGFMRIGNIHPLSAFLANVSHQRLTVKSCEKEQLEIIFDSEPYNLQAKDFIQGLWGPGHIKEWKDFVPPLIIFGFDSV